MEKNSSAQQALQELADEMYEAEKKGSPLAANLFGVEGYNLTPPTALSHPQPSPGE